MRFPRAHQLSVIGAVLAATLLGACASDAPDRRGGGRAVADSAPLDTLLAVLRGAPESAREEAAVALARPGPRLQEQIDALGAALRDTNSQLGSTAAWALSQLGAASIPTLVSGVTDNRPGVRYNSVYALGAIGQATPPATQAVNKALTDPDPTVRKAAAWAMTQLGPQPSKLAGGTALGSAEDLAAGLKGLNPMERLNAVIRYQGYAGEEDRSIPLLIRALGDQDTRVRAAAGNALVSLGSPAQAALSTALSDSNPVVRREASVTLVRMSGKLH
ncbi:MAG TPA: HEAT repeat domain-containing protein [Gemmatimonadales bacterium]|jgi:HEAT repeat protein